MAGNQGKKGSRKANRCRSSAQNSMYISEHRHRNSHIRRLYRHNLKFKNDTLAMKLYEQLTLTLAPSEVKRIVNK